MSWLRAAGRPQLLRAAALAGLVEGVAIARHEVWMGDPGQLFRAAGWLVAVVVVSLAAWTLAGLVLQSLLAAERLTPAVLTLWAVVVVVGRLLLGENFHAATWWLIGAALLLAWGSTIWSRRRWLSGSWPCELGVILIGTASLVGRVPDPTFAALQLIWFAVTSALVAVLLLAAAVRVPRFLIGAMAALLLAAGLLPRFSPGGEGPNVLFIMVDTTRQDHVSPFGELVSTPAVERLAAEGVRFDEAVTVVPKTPASVASFFTGRYPAAHGVRGLYDRLAEAEVTLAEAFTDAGYLTAAFVNNGWLSVGRGFGQGFGRYFGYYQINRVYGPLDYLSWLLLADRLTVQRIPRFSAQTSSKVLTDRVIDFLERQPRQPFFVYAHYFEPHWPYLPPAAAARRHGAPEDGHTLVNFYGRSGITQGQMVFQNPLPEAENEKARRLYRGEVDHTMEQVGRLLAAVDRLALGDDTIVVLTADHGHSLGEHAYHFHHGSFLYDSTVRIPLVIRWPGRLPAGTVVESQVRSIDLPPTLARLAGVRGLQEPDGIDLARLWESSADPGPDAYLESDVKMFSANLRRDFGGIVGKLRAIRTARHKLILTPTRRGPALELYELESDPGEVRNLAGDPAYAEVLSELQARLADLMPAAELRELADAAGVEPPADPEKLDESEAEMLRGLGYIN